MMETNENILEEHHVHPKFMDNSPGSGKTIKLKKKDHNILHLIIPSIIWKYIPEEKKKICIDEVMNFTLYWVNKHSERTSQIIKSCLQEGLLIDKEVCEVLQKRDDWREIVTYLIKHSKDKVITIAKFKEIFPNART